MDTRNKFAGVILASLVAIVLFLDGGMHIAYGQAVVQNITFVNPGSQALSAGIVDFRVTSSVRNKEFIVDSSTQNICTVTTSAFNSTPNDNLLDVSVTLRSAGICEVIATEARFLSEASEQRVRQTFIVYGASRALAIRGGIDVVGDNRSDILLRVGTGILTGRLVNNQFLYTARPNPDSAARTVAAADFLGDGRSDLAFQNTNFLDVNGRSNVSILDNFANNAAARTLRLVKPVWDVQAVGDLDGDGLGDIVWRYTAADPRDTGVSYVWFSTGTTEPVVRKRGGAPLDWKLLGAADLNFDRAADMVYISPTREVRVLMATANRTCANFAVTRNQQSFDVANGGIIRQFLPFDAVGLKVADFTGQRRGDILARNPTNGLTYLLSLNAVGMPLPSFTGNADDPNANCTTTNFGVAGTLINLGVVDPTWNFFASGDFNGDAITDIVWVRPNGQLTVWLMAAGGVIGTTIDNAGAAPTNSYTVIQP